MGATADLAGPLPAELAGRYDLDALGFELGSGRALFERASTALLAWRHFEVPGVALYGAGEPAHPGQIVATLVRIAGLWFLNPCRVVYLQETPDRVGFGYGTLPGHPASGEERFVVHLEPDSERVRYEIAAFSRPATLLPRLAKPLARRIQKRFAKATGRALARACR